jgi:uncharacterized protein (DUF885 family)
MDTTTTESRVTALADRYVERYFEQFPEHATLVGLKGAAHDRLADISSESRAAWHAEQDSVLAELERLDTAGLAPDSTAALTYGFLRELLRNDQQFRACHTELWQVSPTFNGWPQQLALLASAQPVATPEQQEAALRRFAELPRYVDQEIENAREGLRRGYSMPRGNVEAVLPQLDTLLSLPLDRSPFVAMAAKADSGFRSKLMDLEMRAIRPAVARYRDYVRDEYLPSSRESIGMSMLPAGVSGYRAAIRYYATVDMAPDEVHQLGLQQMQAIRTEMRDIAARSFDTDDVAEALHRLRTEPRYLVGSREALLAIARDAVTRSGEALGGWFGRLPRAPVVVEPVPAFAEASAPAGYYNSPAEDGSRPGIYFINLRDAERLPRAGLESTAFHEAYPGHHLQISLAQERPDLHAVSRHFFMSGYGEGWALYSERLSDEMGLFSSDVDRMGLLSNEALRAARLVVDPGIHALGWTRQQAIDYMLAHTTESPGTVAAEVDRYIAVPGQATSYMIGSVEMLRLRRLAESRLGGEFRLSEFHDRVLADGSVPLVMLREKIERWIAGQESSSARNPNL